MKSPIKLSTKFGFPLDFVTQTAAVIAKKRVGKSYTMRRLAEQLHKAGQQIVLIDPKGDQWGIRSSADGKGAGLAVIIFGGERGDVPLEVASGELVAKLVVEERVSAVLDLSHFRKHEVATFMTAFLETLYRLKAREVYRTPVMLIVDEADAIAPQQPQPNEARVLGASEDIVRRGGQRGIGCMLITQRTAVLNKNVLTQAQIMPQRVQLSRKKGFNLQATSRALNGLEAVKVTRPGRWGNPYKLEHYRVVGLPKKTCDAARRSMAVRDYEMWLYAVPEGEAIAAVARVELRGKNLACWCPIPKPGEDDVCHAAILVRVANTDSVSPEADALGVMFDEAAARNRARP